MGQAIKSFLMQNDLRVVQMFLIIAYTLLSSCNGIMQQEKGTPKKFLNHTVIKKENYTKDSLEIEKRLKVLLAKHEDFFYSKAYFDSTEFIIDSIIYSPDFNKLAVFVITKNPIYRQLIPDKNSEWYYDATCYLGIRQYDTIALSWIGPVFTNSSSRQSISNDIRDACFKTFVTKDTTDAYDYNLNDARFWHSSIWKKIKDEKMRKKDFEEEKKNHPENVYEPKK
jgi:hypothetical protein